jgi:hypothetical protein
MTDDSYLISINNFFLIDEFELLNATNTIYNELLTDLKKEEQITNTIKSLIKNNKKKLINIENFIENELEFSESDDFFEKLYDKPIDYSKMISTKYYKMNRDKLEILLYKKEKQLNVVLGDIDFQIEKAFDIKLVHISTDYVYAG